jgi:manganese/iron transport system permease protein
LLEPFQLPFMQRAAIEVALLAPIAGILGAQVVLRRLAFFTHSVGAATFPGLVLAGPAGIPPALAALGAGGAFAGLLTWTERRARLANDAATALLLVAALAIGVILASDVFESGAGVDRLLFGSLLAIGDGELALTGAALLLAAAAAAAFRRTWIATGFDPELAGSQRLRTGLAELALMASLAVAVIASLDAVGSLLVSAIFVLPAASVRVLAPSVRSLEAGSAALALAEGLAGLLLAFELDAPPGATIAVIGGVVFALCVTWRTLARGREAEATA